jgi:hypothetical protein
MSTFVTAADYKSKINSDHLRQILDDPDYTEDQILTEAEEYAMAEVLDALTGTYDVEAIFEATGSDRPKNVLRWITIIVIYYLYERIPDDFVPDRVVKNYNDTMDTLDAISDGKKKVSLPVLADEEGNVSTKFRSGSQTARSH